MALQIRGNAQILSNTIENGQISSSASISLSKLSLSDSATFSGTLTLSTVDINGGNIDGTTIATSDITVGSDKTLDVSAGDLILADNQISGDKINGGTIDTINIDSVNIDGGSIDGTAIGSSSASSASFTTLGTSGAATLQSTLGVTGATTLSSTLTVASDFSVNTDKFTVNSSTGDASVGGDLSVTGDLLVSGDTVTVNVATLQVEDPLILLARSNTSSSFSKTDTITASGGASGDSFGYGSSISGDGNVLVVGASHWDQYYQDQGAVYIYDWSDTDDDGTADSWVQRGSILNPSDPGQLDRFGSTCATNGDGSIIAVGSPQWDGNNFDQGTAYVFEYVSGSWSQKGSVLVPNDIGAQDLHCTVGLSSDGTILAVGSIGWDGSGTNQGAVYIYDWNESTEDWDQRTRITPSDAAGGDGFGYSVSFSSDGTILAIGSRDWEGTYSDQGGVYIYDWSDTNNDNVADTWVQRGDVIVSNSEGSGTIGFGLSVELNGNGTVLAVSQVGDGWSSQTNKRVEIFDWNSSTEVWDYRTKIDAEYDSTRTASQSGFGLSVGMTYSGSKIVVGATTDNSNKGAVYVYDLVTADNLDIGFYGLYNDGSDKYAGLFRDRSDSGKFKLFDGLTSEPGTEVGDVSSLKGTLVANIEGNITFDDARTFSLSGDLSGSQTFDGSGNCEIEATIVANSVEFSMLNCELDDDTFATASDTTVPTSESVKAYVDAQVSSGGLSSLEAKDMLMVDSTESYVKVKEVIQYSLISSTDISNSFVSLSTNVELEFDELSMVYLNGQKLRFGNSSQVSSSERDYYFDENTKNKIYFSANTITENDRLEMRYMIKS